LETDSKGAIQSVDRAFENVLGWPEELLLGQGVSEVISFGESSGSWNSEEVVAEVLRKGIAVALPPGTYLRAADGTLRAVEGLIAPDRDCSRALFVLRCRELETTSQDSLSRYWALADFVLETCGAGYLVLDRDLKVVRASSNFFERIGFEPEAVIGRSVLDFPGGLFRQEAVLARLREGFVQKTPLESCPVSTTLGKLGDRSFEIAARPLGTGDPPLGLLVVLRDVSHRKRLEQERHEAMVNLERVVEAAPLIFWMCDSSGLIQTSVGGGLKSLGLEPRALVGTHFEEHLAQQPERERLLTAFQEALQGVPQVFDTHYRGRFYRSHFFPHRDAAGNIVGVVGTCLDLTETETLEGALTEAKRNLNAVLHLLPSEIMWLDQEGNVTDVSGPASALLGRSREDILGVPFDGFLSVPSQAVFRELWARQVTGDGLTAELEVKRPDGSTRGVLL
jgi:PAS domain S-box-containing protein